jgi:hypothetical protein
MVKGLQGEFDLDRPIVLIGMDGIVPLGIIDFLNAALDIANGLAQAIQGQRKVIHLKHIVRRRQKYLYAITLIDILGNVRKRKGHIRVNAFNAEIDIVFAGNDSNEGLIVRHTATVYQHSDKSGHLRDLIPDRLIHTAVQNDAIISKKSFVQFRVLLCIAFTQSKMAFSMNL